MLLLTGPITTQSEVIPHELARGKSRLLASVCSDQNHRFGEGQVHSSRISAQWCVTPSTQTPQPEARVCFFSRDVLQLSPCGGLRELQGEDSPYGALLLSLVGL